MAPFLQLGHHFAKAAKKWATIVITILKFPSNPYQDFGKVLVFLNTILKGFPEIQLTEFRRILTFGDRNLFLSTFFITKFSLIISNLNNDCSQLPFEVYNFGVAQKLPIVRFFLSIFFHLDPWPLWRPPEAAILTLLTSIGYQILAEDFSLHMRYCLLLQNKIGRGQTTFPKMD